MKAASKRFILWLFTPLQKLLQRIGRQETLITTEQVDLILSLAQDGDIFLSYEKGRPTSVFIKGFYDHAAIFNRERMQIIEAVGDKFKNGVNIGGVRAVDVREWLYKKDSVCVLRPVYDSTFIHQNPNMKAASNSLEHIGKPYDYTFNKFNEKIYCSELVYLCYKEHDPRFMEHIESDQILPIDYYQACLIAGRDDMFMRLVVEVKNA